MRFTYVLLLLKIISIVKCAKILGVFPSPGYSQFILAEKLVTELTARGHEVTVISLFKSKENEKNYKNIVIDNEQFKISSEMLYQQASESYFSTVYAINNYLLYISECILSHKYVQELIHSNETFDLVIVEQIVNDALKGFSSHFNAPLISFYSVGLTEWSSYVIGNIRPPSVNPAIFSSYTDRMTFFQRVYNSFFSLFSVVYQQFISFPFQQQLLNKYFPKKIMLKDVMYNSSILLLNSHSTLMYPSTLTSAAIEIGGFHICPKKLPTHIQKFLDEASEGVVLFSMGSNLKSVNLPKGKLEGILKAFSKLKQRVLWKFEGQSISDIPGNVMLSKWLPQSDILAHPNIVAFITHGGLLGTTEAIHYGVPMIGIPIFFDQYMNVALSVDKQIAVHLPFNQLTEESLLAALKEIIRNPVYSRNIKKLSSIYHDRIVKPLDLAMFSIEYVLKHGGAPHLKNATIELYWFQLYLIDVICFVISCLLLFYYSIKVFLHIINGNVKLRIETKHKRKLN